MKKESDRKRRLDGLTDDGYEAGRSGKPCESPVGRSLERAAWENGWRAGRKERDDHRAAAVFSCPAKHYAGDGPHLWHVREDGVEARYWPDKGQRVRAEEKACSEHARRPIVLKAIDLLNGIKIPGFVNSVTARKLGWDPKEKPTEVFKTEGDGVSIEIWMWGPPRGEKRRAWDSKASGHTSFSTDKGWNTFDRTGVEDSFYLKWGDDVADVQAIIEKQLARVAESRARIATMTNVPGIPFLVDAKKRVMITDLLKKGSSYEFRPSGFGTGYRLTTRQYSRWMERAKPETEAFFGVSPIWVEKTDCD